jgi:hypothetical protein
MNQNKCIIFDIDGTLVNIEHRKIHVKKPKNFKKFYEAIPQDSPHDDIIYLARLLHLNPYPVIIVTGREEVCRPATEKQLADLQVPYMTLYMRPLKDYRPDYLVKKDVLSKIRLDGYEPFMVFEDRQQVVDMWRAEGVRCLQVEPGNF